jgi:hypothetical protein
MTLELSPAQVRGLRLRAQGLHPAQARDSVVDCVDHLAGLQAQELPSGTLGVRVRSRDLRAEDVRRAREAARSIVLTWTLRGTMHLIAAPDLGWMLRLLGPVFIRKSQRRYAQLDLDEAARTRAIDALQAVLQQRGPLIRAEIAGALAAQGIPVAGQAIAHLVRYAALAGVICYGPEQAGELTYARIADWLPPGLFETEPDDALAELARRYLAAYGPATPADFASWSGLGMGEARTGFDLIAAELLEVLAAGEPAWMLVSQAVWLDLPPDTEPVVCLLPRYDTYLLGYQNRDLSVPEPYARRVHPGGGIIKPVVLVDGQAMAIWHTERQRDTILVVVEPFADLEPAWLPHLEAEVADLARFWQQATSLEIVTA